MNKPKANGPYISQAYLHHTLSYAYFLIITLLLVYH